MRTAVLREPQRRKSTKKRIDGQYEKEKATDDLETDCRGGKLECEDRNH